MREDQGGNLQAALAEGQQDTGFRTVDVTVCVLVREIEPGLFAATSVMLPGVYSWARSAEEAVADFRKSCAQLARWTAEGPVPPYKGREGAAASCRLPAAELIQFPGELRYSGLPRAGSFDGGSAA